MWDRVFLRGGVNLLGRCTAKEEWLERVVGVKGRRHDIEGTSGKEVQPGGGGGVAGVEVVKGRMYQGCGERRGKKRVRLRVSSEAKGMAWRGWGGAVGTEWRLGHGRRAKNRGG